MSYEQAVVRLEEANAKLVEEVTRFRDAAAGLNNIYTTTAEGIAGVADGKYFVVPGNGTFLTLYRRNGAAANEVAEFPSRTAMEAAVNAAADNAEARATVEADRAVTEADRAFAEANRAMNEADSVASASAAAAFVDQTKTGNAVDVFVYDTSRDSDGGAWRHRCQHTSWYNELLNTATRGARREFPAVAVIVAEEDKVTIYDGDDPTMPMWMVFNYLGWQVNDAIALWNGPNSLFMVNGYLCVGHANGVARYGFINDYVENSRRSFNAVFSNGIVGRNTRSAYESNTVWTLVSNVINDVAMTVLPNAPIDPATGLPVPTIAVATDGGVSIIKDDGTVVDFFAANFTYSYINFTLSGSVVVYVLSTKTMIVIDPIKVSSNVYDEGGLPSVFVSNSTQGGNELIPTPLSNQDIAYARYETASLGGPNGFGVLNQNPFDKVKGMVAYLTSTYNTGWMPGDIKLAALSDTDTTDLVGSGELVTNGTFDVDISGWTNPLSTRGSLYFSAQKLRIQTASSATEYRVIGSYSISTEIGKTYKIELESFYVSSAINFRVGAGESATSSGLGAISLYSGQSAHVHFKATQSTTYINVQILDNDPDVALDIDNISVKLVDHDRSANNNGLIVNGTVTREPVAPGSDLVAYSGFSATNYLEQPYNPDLDFGTGDFCVMGWVKGNPSTGRIFYRGASTSDELRFVVDLDADGKLRLFTTNETTTPEIFRSHTPIDENWKFFTAFRSNGAITVFVDGVYKTTNVSTHSVVNTSATSCFGVGTNGGVPFTGSLALWRIFATAPSPEQIKKIYEDEKVLFQENAQATLYGSSDAVTALAHDEVTDLLHVGTSAGRSVFQGLRRVDNTTDPVTTAISAHNNLIVEE